MMVDSQKRGKEFPGKVWNLEMQCMTHSTFLLSILWTAIVGWLCRFSQKRQRAERWTRNAPLPLVVSLPSFFFLYQGLLNSSSTCVSVYYYHREKYVSLTALLSLLARPVFSLCVLSVSVSQSRAPEPLIFPSNQASKLTCALIDGWMISNPIFHHHQTLQ